MYVWYGHKHDSRYVKFYYGLARLDITHISHGYFIAIGTVSHKSTIPPLPMN